MFGILAVMSCTFLFILEEGIGYTLWMCGTQTKTISTLFFTRHISRLVSFIILELIHGSFLLWERKKVIIIVLKHLMTWNEENSNQGITPRNLLFHHSNHNLILLTIKRIQGYFLVQIWLPLNFFPNFILANLL